MTHSSRPPMPYDAGAVPGSVLKLEDVNFDRQSRDRLQLHGYAISARRDDLFNLTSEGTTLFRKPSEHRPGHLLNRTDPESGDRAWIRQCWEYVIGADGLKRPMPEPYWLDRPAVSCVCARDRVGARPDSAERPTLAVRSIPAARRDVSVVRA
jgi:hypothetical protein